MSKSPSVIEFQVMWDRLIAIAEEQGQVLIRTAFSPVVRECGDISAGIFDPQGRMLAQGITGTPGHVNTMAESVGHFLAAFPTQTMKPGDTYICNDPWKGTGHLNDFVVTTPVFKDSKLVALFSCTSHIVDIGGVHGLDGTDMFMEGLQIPMLKLVDQGKVNETLMAMIRQNSRLPEESEGDVYALASCNEVASRRLVEMMEEFGLGTLDALSAHIIERSREAVLGEIRKLPKGSWTYEMTADGDDTPVTLKARLTISDDGIDVDYAGSSGPARRGLNVPLPYARAYTSFGIGCVVAGHIPNNAGSLDPIRVSAPKGCILNAQPPVAVHSRHAYGQLLPDMVFGCLRQAVPDMIPAESTSGLWIMALHGRRRSGPRDKAAFGLAMTLSGGTGARPGKDGLSATAYPSGVMGTPIEIAETQSPLIFLRKELREGSGGAGSYRGGLGQVVEVASREDAPFSFAATMERVKFPARGCEGGENGAPGWIGLGSGEVLDSKGQHEIAPGQSLVLKTPGGAGLGGAASRDPVLEDSDRCNGLTGVQA
ncbi:hydantoinase B/oxoprolinase family protein [Pseudooceanicola sp. CBS1P-1]|uniref:Hydantoinase B/oxoprolinase family protein n=1 Tax=Pseudooceanicola albus TaxID=2692189 RepID=A0A6L7GBJ1_9RHOB|nr:MULTISPECIES: hydantoinase B/oxoprolinase family protein [Pseudooceanicola]MBT9386590.1 hydantoinase B/oxoprolinase family protein [Pseudooceanicola endophyticus]MXN20706.1 hydantoinase B/oxoprolinase family protein [Pseudooceanicola albus]